MKLLFLVGHLCKERHGLLDELIIDLDKQGISVTVLTGYPSRRISNEVRLSYLKKPIEMYGNSVIINRVGSKNGEGNNLLVRFLRYLLLSRTIYKKSKKIEFDAVFIYSSPPFLGYLSKKYKKIGKPVIYNAQDLFPDSLINMKNISPTNIIIKIFRKYELSLYENVSKIITISHDMSETIINNGAKAEKIHVIFNWADKNKLRYIPRDSNSLFDEFNIDRKKFIISYGGDIGYFQNWQIIMKLFKELISINNDILIVIFGEGSYKNELKSIIKNENISNIIVLPLQPSNKVSEIYSLGDLELVTLNQGMTKLALPSKIGTISAVGNAFLALFDSNSKIYEMLKIYDVGVIGANNEITSMIDQIQNIYYDRNMLFNYKRNSRKLFTDNFDRQAQTTKYFNVISEIFDGDK